MMTFVIGLAVGTVLGVAVTIKAQELAAKASRKLRRFAGRRTR
jgi:hypothetical protein